jgi:hypothetical protein
MWLDTCSRAESKWTNARAWASYHQANGEEAELPSIVESWRDVTVNEVSKLIGMHLYMGVSRKPELHDYWATQGIHITPFFQSLRALSRDRFKQILSFLRFYDADDEGDEDDALRKMRPFLTEVEQICTNVYQPEQRVSADESLILYKGRLLIRQYIPTKRARFGIKVYCACESSTGYLLLIHCTQHTRTERDNRR